MRKLQRFFLERGDVDPDLGDPIWGRSPLLWAAAQGNEGVVKVFLERESVHTNQASPGYGQAAFYFAAAYGHEGIVNMILEQGSVDPNQQPTGYFYTPLSIAALNGHEGVVKMFLEREDIDPNLADTDDGRKPLSNAAVNGCEEIVKMLLERNDIRIDKRDYKNQTPVSLALSYGHDKIARMISERAAIKSDTLDPSNQESLPPLARHGKVSVVETQVSDHPDTNIANHGGEPTLPTSGPNTPEEVSGCEGSFLNSAANIIPSSQPSRAPPLLPQQPPEFQNSSIPTVTHPNNAPPTPSLVVKQYLVTASLICILAFLLYFVPFP